MGIDQKPIIENALHAIPEKIDPRAFKIEEVTYKGRIISIVYLETKDRKQRNRPDDYWKQIEKKIIEASVIFVEYFPEELVRNVYHVPGLGFLAKQYARSVGLEEKFGKISEIAARENKQIAVADVANKYAYTMYEFGSAALPLVGGIPGLLSIPINTLKILNFIFTDGSFNPEPNDIEKVIPDAIDARRIITAKGIMEEAERRVEGSTLMYIGAPAHASRVSKMIQLGPSIFDQVKDTALYKQMIGLDRSVRIFKPTHDQKSWIRISNIPIS